MKKNNWKTFLKTCGVVALAGIMLVGCGSSDAGADGGHETTAAAENTADEEAKYSNTDDEYTATVSEVLKTENIWYYTDASSGVAKDSEIKYVFVFDGDGNVTTYSLNLDGLSINYYELGGEYLTFGDLDGLTDEEIIEKAKEIEQNNFELVKDDVYDDAYEIYDDYVNTVAADEEKAAIAKELLEYIEAAEWTEPEAEAYTLHAYTDDTGNTTISEEITLPGSSSYEFQTTYHYIAMGIDAFSSGDCIEYDPSVLLDYKAFEPEIEYSTCTMDLTLELGSESTRTVYSTDYIALGELSMKYTSYITITYDPPTTDGIEID